MSEFIVCLIKYTAIFACILYAYTKLLRIKLKVWDLFDIPIFIALSAVLYFVTVYVKILVPIGLLIFSVAFLFLRFRKTFYETVTVGTIALGISIILMVLALIVGFLVALLLYLIEDEAVRTIVAQLIDAIIQIVGIFLLFKIKRLKSGVNPKGETATFEILLFFSVGCIFTMTLFYTNQSLYEIVLLASALCGLLLILWWFKHIKYNYRKGVEQQRIKYLEDTIAELKANSAENELKLAVYAKQLHYLNRVLINCARFAESAAAQNDCAEVHAQLDLMHGAFDEMDIVYEKCSLENIPKTGEKLLDAPIVELYAATQSKNFKVSADISADVKSWFAENKLAKIDVHKLLCYLCDNAMNSALGSPNAKVCVELGETANKKPLIRVYDSGEQFDEGVLEKLGLEQITTRAGVGGSGIGLFTVFQILAKYGASFTLDEEPQSFGFTKFIEIAFDGCRGVLVRTYRESVVAVCAARKGITVELLETLRDGTNG